MSKLLLLIGLIALQVGIVDAAKPDKPDRPNIALSIDPFGVKITWTAPSATGPMSRPAAGARAAA